jgi:threonine/homoserine/homoserine lactone efflux protein
MWLELLIRGVVIGLIASIPLGPMGVLCIQRTLSKNHSSGFVSGLGAATADMVFASMALFSLGVVLSFIESHLTIIKAVGGICIIMVGINIFFTNPVIQIRRNRAGKSNLWQDYISMLLLTIANPAYILIFVALFAALGLNGPGLGFAHSLLLIAGVLGGAALWWFALTAVVSMLRRRFRPRMLLWMNRISGGVIVGLGVAALMLIFVNTPVDALM